MKMIFLSSNKSPRNPEEWLVVRKPIDCIRALIRTDIVDILSVDESCLEYFDKDRMSVIDYIEYSAKRGIVPNTVFVHSSNIFAAERIARIIGEINRTYYTTIRVVRVKQD